MAFDLWKGKPVTDMTKEELIVALHELGELYKELHDRYMMSLDDEIVPRNNQSHLRNRGLLRAVFEFWKSAPDR